MYAVGALGAQGLLPGGWGGRSRIAVAVVGGSEGEVRASYWKVWEGAGATSEPGTAGNGLKLLAPAYSGLTGGEPGAIFQLNISLKSSKHCLQIQR